MLSFIGLGSYEAVDLRTPSEGQCVERVIRVVVLHGYVGCFIRSARNNVHCHLQHRNIVRYRKYEYTEVEILTVVLLMNSYSAASLPIMILMEG